MTQDTEALLVELDANAKVDRRHGFTHDAEIWKRAAAAIRELQKNDARYRLLREKGQCHGKVFGGFTVPGSTNRNTLVAFRYWCKAAELAVALDSQLGK